ncbi:MAG TPA: IS4 family transposase [Ktedonobacteraceae bacterium]
MHDTAVMHMQPSACIAPTKPPSASLAKPIVALLEELLVQSEASCSALMPSGKRPRGRPPTLPLDQLWLALVLGVLRHAKHVSTIWRSLCLETTGSFAVVQVTYEAVRKRLLAAGTAPLQRLFETLSQALAQRSLSQQPAALTLAPFASQVVALDETTLDHLQRLTQDLRDVPMVTPIASRAKGQDSLICEGTRWLRVQFRADVLAGCNTGILLLLEVLAPGSLILADLGYFSFPWFDYLTDQGFFWVSRLKARTTYEIVEVVAYDDRSGTLDALIWLGTYRADRAAHAVRLVSFCFHGTQYRYLTNVLDPQLLSMQEIAHLSARRWHSELAFKLLKCELGLHLWWGARSEVVLIQLWLALILAQLLHALQAHVALQAEVEPFDVSMHRLVELLSTMPAGSTPIIERLVQQGRFLGLIRPSTRIQLVVPAVQPYTLRPALTLTDLVRRARYAQRHRSPRTAPFFSRFTTQLLI